MAEVIERLDVTHNFVTIDSPIKFYIQMNEDTKHRVLKSAQAIQIDCRKLLTRKDMPNIPAWALFIVYDDTLLAEGEKVNWYAHDVDFAGSTDSVNGVLVDVDLSALYAELTANNDALISALALPDFNFHIYENVSFDFVKDLFFNLVGESYCKHFNEVVFITSRSQAGIYIGLDCTLSVGYVPPEGSAAGELWLSLVDKQFNHYTGGSISAGEGLPFCIGTKQNDSGLFKLFETATGIVTFLGFGYR